MGADLERVLAFQDEIIQAYSSADAQRKLLDFAQEAKRQGTPSALAAVEQRESFLLELQKPIVARYGFEASAQGVKDAMFAISKFAVNNLVTKRHNRMETLLNAGDPLDWYNSVVMQQDLRNQGTHRDVPQSRFPIVQRQAWEQSYEGRLAPVPRADMLSAEVTEELAAACKRGDSAKASLLLGTRKVSDSAKAVILNIGYKGLGPLGAKTLAKALSADLEVLELDISGNGIGPEGGKALAAAIPSKLKVFKLNVANNRLTLTGAKALAAAIPKSVEVLSLGMAGMKTGPAGAAAVAAALPPKVRELTLDVFGNGIKDEGVESISRALPKTLEYLNVVLSGNQLSRRGFFMLDRQIGDPLHERHLPNLLADSFIKTGKPEIMEFKEGSDGALTRQLAWQETF